MTKTQITTLNNLWADLSQGMANSQFEPWNNLWADLSQGIANSQIEPWNKLLVGRVGLDQLIVSQFGERRIAEIICTNFFSSYLQHSMKFFGAIVWFVLQA